MHPLLVGGNPFTTTSIYTLILFLEKKWGIHYSMGGTGSVVKALEKLMKEYLQLYFRVQERSTGEYFMVVLWLLEAVLN